MQDLMYYHLSSADNSGDGLFNLANSQLDAQSIGKSLVGVGRGQKTSYQQPANSTKKKTVVQGPLVLIKKRVTKPGLSLVKTLLHATLQRLMCSCKYVD